MFLFCEFGDDEQEYYVTQCLSVVIRIRCYRLSGIPYEADTAEYQFSKSELMPGIAANLTLHHLSRNQGLLLAQCNILRQSVAL